MSWLDPVIRALDRRVTPVEIFVRDDDAGWEDLRLLSLLDRFAAEDFPVDLAVIPTEVRPQLARQLAERASGGPVGLHQHGFAHLDHEPQGRPCEFGPERPIAAQRADIANGRGRLLDLFGPQLDPIFTPPWNRCTPITGTCLAEAGIRTLSRDVSAGPLGVTGVAELPVTLDWFARSAGRRLTPADWADRLASIVTSARTPVGLMLHHAVMDDREQDGWGSLLRVLAWHPLVTGLLMRDAAGVAIQ
jgi:hypothetical protein